MYFSKEMAQNLEKMANIPGGEMRVKSCHVSGYHDCCGLG